MLAKKSQEMWRHQKLMKLWKVVVEVFNVTSTKRSTLALEKVLFLLLLFFFTPLRGWRKPPRFTHVNNVFWWAAILPHCHQNSHVENLTHFHSHKRANSSRTRECVCRKCPQVVDPSIPGAVIMSQRKPPFPLTKSCWLLNNFVNLQCQTEGRQAAHFS